MNAIRYALATLLAFIAFNAFGGGIYGMAGAGGVPTEWLTGSPFPSYFVPSLVLFFLVGGACLGAAILVYAGARQARMAAIGAATIVAAWILAQVAIIGFVSWMQPVTLATALAVAVLAWELALPRAPVALTSAAHAEAAGFRGRAPGEPVRALVTWGSKRGGTEGIARILADGLRRDGIEVLALPADQVSTLRDIDAVIVGGALYMNRWHRAARRFVRRHADELCNRPVWFFSSGPLDASADGVSIPPTTQVASLMRMIGARGHVTFGGRLEPDARGLIAHAMAKKTSGDWRNPERIRAWADELAVMLPTARPGVAVVPERRGVSRLLAHV